MFLVGSFSPGLPKEEAEIILKSEPGRGHMIGVDDTSESVVVQNWRTGLRWEAVALKIVEGHGPFHAH